MQVPAVAQLGVRAAMTVCPLLALAFVSASVAHVTETHGSPQFYITIKYMLGSPAIAFAQLTSFVGMLYGAWFLVGVELLKRVDRPRVLFERAIDGVFALCYLIGGSALAASEYNAHCDLYTFTRCGNLTAAIVFSFFAVVPHLVTLGLSFVGQQPQPSAQDPTTAGAYVAAEATPVAKVVVDVTEQA